MASWRIPYERFNQILGTETFARRMFWKLLLPKSHYSDISHWVCILHQTLLLFCCSLWVEVKGRINEDYIHFIIVNRVFGRISWLQREMWWLSLPQESHSKIDIYCRLGRKFSVFCQKGKLYGALFVTETE